MMRNEMSFEKLKENISKEVNIIEELNELAIYFKKIKSAEEKRMFSNQINSLEKSLIRTNKEVLGNVEKVSLIKPLKQTPVIKEPVIQPSITPPVQPIQKVVLPPAIPAKTSKKDFSPSSLEKLTLKRLGIKEKKIVKKRERKPNSYVQMASKMFYRWSFSMVKKGRFKKLQRDLIKANLEFVPANYVAVIFFTTLLSFLLAIFIFLFFLFFNFSATPPFITVAGENMGIRLLKVFWILLVIPTGVFFLTYFYPSLEKKSLATKINHELPFASIHMAAISGSMIDPTKIFSIVISTKEYPNLQKEFTKLMNEINVYGYDLVSALRSIAFNSPSMKLSEFFNGLATTITSGGNLPDFFDKRAQTLLFEHRLDREKQAKAAETFMDIYISVVIAAPMILMLLLIMMRISGLGIGLSTTMITLVMILGVIMVNILFLTFLHLKQPQV
jgi:flagellar protein FlaJ